MSIVTSDCECFRLHYISLCICSNYNCDFEKSCIIYNKHQLHKNGDDI